MTDDELVKRLRERGGPDQVAAADRILALRESRDALQFLVANKLQALIVAEEQRDRLKGQLALYDLKAHWTKMLEWEDRTGARRDAILEVIAQLEKIEKNG